MTAEQVLETADGVTIVRVDSRAGLEQAWDVRLEVFVAEQRVPVEEEVDDLDTAPTTTHVLALDDVSGRALGTGRLLSDPAHPGEVHLGRLAVRSDARGRGVGARLVVAVEALALAEHAVASSDSRPAGTGGTDAPGAVAASSGTDAQVGAEAVPVRGEAVPGRAVAPDGSLAVTVALSAQESALRFYQRLGYSVVSGERYLDAGIWHRDMARTITS